MEVLTDVEHDMLRFIRKYKINIAGIASLACGIIYNYSSKRYTVETEDILLESEDENDTDENTSLKAGVEYSNLNKLVMRFINGTSTNNIVVLGQILKILLRHHKIIYSEMILDVIDRLCRDVEVNNKNVTVETEKSAVGDLSYNGIEMNATHNAAQTKNTIGVNTDITGEIVKPPCQKRKLIKPRPDVIPATLNRYNNRFEDTFVPQNEVMQSQQPRQDLPVFQRQYGPEQYPSQFQQNDRNPFMQEMHYQQISQQNNHPFPAFQEVFVNRNVVNQPQGLNQNKQSPIDRTHGGHFYSPQILHKKRSHTPQNSNQNIAMPSKKVLAPAMAIPRNPTVCPVMPLTEEPLQNFQSDFQGMQETIQHYSERVPSTIGNQFNETQTMPGNVNAPYSITNEKVHFSHQPQMKCPNRMPVSQQQVNTN